MKVEFAYCEITPKKFLIQRRRFGSKAAWTRIAEAYSEYDVRVIVTALQKAQK